MGIYSTDRYFGGAYTNYAAEQVYSDMESL
jgi:hypothetical protein